ncbi:ImmA/IrrE family metallo-endopeptidase [Candidatus Pacearchaeota archaeon]|nr:ImmA/IrrE family metallo-endopeptidase [Candidatus Pacearchaeota archaeon]
MQNLIVNLNKERLNHILTLYNLPLSELVIKLNKANLKLKKPITKEDIISSENKIKLSLLKKIDKILGKGLTYYIDSAPPVKTNETSIFFRKNQFNIELTLESKKVVNFFEELKFTIQNLISNVDVKLNRKLKKYSLSESPEKVAQEIRSIFNGIYDQLISSKEIQKETSDRQFLKNLARVIEEFNIFIFEHIDHPAKKEKVNFNGFFVRPNMIILSGQKYYKREIFTLIHEFAHYLLDDEEIDQNVGEDIDKKTLIETWCNDFSYFFLIGGFKDEMDKLQNFSKENNFHEELLERISKRTRLSTLSLYTYLKIKNRISQRDYDSISKEIEQAIQKAELKERKKQDTKKFLAQEKGEEYSLIVPLRKPLHSKLFIDVLKMNYYNGDIDKNIICKFLKIKEDKIGEVLYV